LWQVSKLTLKEKAQLHEVLSNYADIALKKEMVLPLAH